MMRCSGFLGSGQLLHRNCTGPSGDPSTFFSLFRELVKLGRFATTFSYPEQCKKIFLLIQEYHDTVESFGEHYARICTQKKLNTEISSKSMAFCADFFVSFGFFHEKLSLMLSDVKMWYNMAIKRNFQGMFDKFERFYKICQKDPVSRNIVLHYSEHLLEISHNLKQKVEIFLSDDDFKAFSDEEQHNFIEDLKHFSRFFQKDLIREIPSRDQSFFNKMNDLMKDFNVFFIECVSLISGAPDYLECIKEIGIVLKQAQEATKLFDKPNIDQSLKESHSEDLSTLFHVSKNNENSLLIDEINSTLSELNIAPNSKNEPLENFRLIKETLYKMIVEKPDTSVITVSTKEEIKDVFRDIRAFKTENEEKYRKRYEMMMKTASYSILKTIGKPQINSEKDCFDNAIIELKKEFERLHSVIEQHRLQDERIRRYIMANINPILETSTENSPDLYDTIINAIESKIEKNDI